MKNVLALELVNRKQPETRNDCDIISCKECFYHDIECPEFKDTVSLPKTHDECVSIPCKVCPLNSIISKNEHCQYAVYLSGLIK